MHLFVVIPAFNESQNIIRVVQELSHSCDENELIEEHTILVVDDHSEDDTYQKVRDFGKENIRALRLSRRCGSHTAIRAGLAHSNGDALLCVSADGQDNASDILSEMIQKIKGGVHIVWGIREQRKEPLFVKLWAVLFYRILFLFAPKGNQRINYANADFYMIQRKVVNAINSCQERNTSLFGLIIWSGFKQDFVSYKRRDRFSGKSKWNFKSKMNLALDWILAFSGLPLRFITYTGIAFAILGFLYAILIVILALMGRTTPGFAETVILILIIGGVQMVMIGIIGEYLWRTLEESRKRPLYFEEEASFHENQK